MTKPKPCGPRPWGAILAECDPEQLLTIEQTRGIFGVSRSTIDTWQATKRPPPRTSINGLPRYRVKDVRAALAGDAMMPSFMQFASAMGGSHDTYPIVMVPTDFDGPPRPIGLPETLYADVIDDRAVLHDMTLAEYADALGAYATARKAYEDKAKIAAEPAESQRPRKNS